MNRFLILILCAFAFSCNYTTGSGNIRTEERNTKKFEGVKVSGSLDVEVIHGSPVSVRVEADDNVLPDIITEVEDDLLEVRYRPGRSFVNVHAKVYVTAQALKRLYVNGSGTIESKNTLRTSENMRTGISGSGDIKAKIDAPVVEADVSGSGNMLLEGHCRDFSGTISGSGNLQCGDLLSENTTVTVGGSGTAHVYASVLLKATVSGSGSIYYGGNPASTQISKAGSGSIQAEKED